MPYNLRINAAVGCVFIKWRGVITRESYIAYQQDVELSPAFRPGLNRFHDIREAAANHTPEDIRSFANYAIDTAARHGAQKSATLAPTDLAFGMSRLAHGEMSALDLDHQTFRDLDAAMVWLGLPGDLGDPFVDL